MLPFVAVCMLTLLCSLHDLNRMMYPSLSQFQFQWQWSHQVTLLVEAFAKVVHLTGYIVFQCLLWQAESVFLLLYNL